MIWAHVLRGRRGQTEAFAEQSRCGAGWTARRVKFQQDTRQLHRVELNYDDPRHTNHIVLIRRYEAQSKPRVLVMYIHIKFSMVYRISLHAIRMTSCVIAPTHPPIHGRDIMLARGECCDNGDVAHPLIHLTQHTQEATKQLCKT